MTKNSIRKSILENMTDLEVGERKEIEDSLHENLFNTDLWKNAESIGVTVSQDSEWDTKGIIEQAWEENKKASVPKSIHKTRELHFYQLDDFDQLEVGYYDLQEPQPEKTIRIEAEDIDLLIVPGIAFSKQGYRIGFGGGFYDRFLSNFPNHTVSLAYTKQLITDIPVEEHDIPVDLIVNEQETIDCREHRK